MEKRAKVSATKTVKPETFLDGKVTLYGGDMLKVLPTLKENSIDSCVCDPPYHLTSIMKRFGKTSEEKENFARDNNHAGYRRLSSGFMGKQWDGGDIAFRPETWKEVYRVLKPGGHLLAFGGTRTFGRMQVAIEEAGFEVRDTIAWLYGCLDEQTELVTPDGVKPYHKAIVGDPVLCYDPALGEYNYQPILEIVEYEYDDTAYRLIGDFGEQIVTRNHRCIVEQDGMEVFQFAEEAALERQACVPVLESLPELQQALSMPHQGTSNPKQDMRAEVCWKSNQSSKDGRYHSYKSTQGKITNTLRGLWQGVLAQYQSACQNGEAGVFTAMQWCSAWAGVETARPQGAFALETIIGSRVNPSYDRFDQSRLEGRSDLSQTQKKVRGSANQVCSLSSSFHFDGSQGRLCDGASADRGASYWSSVDSDRDCTSSQPQSDGEQKNQSDVIRHQRGSQSIRAWRGHRSAMVRIVPFHYVGKVWCLRVPTGAFVAVRSGVAFPTGNSGFPKSHDVSKHIDAKLTHGKTSTRQLRKVNAERPGEGKIGNRLPNAGIMSGNMREAAISRDQPITKEAAAWSGWGSAIKPAMELVIVARKPLEGTIAANVLKWGTGAINVDGCRVSTEENLNGGAYAKKGGRQESQLLHGNTGMNVAGKTVGTEFKQPPGRWPANVIHDGSEEVVAGFPESDSGGGGSIKFHSRDRSMINLAKNHLEWSGYSDSGQSPCRFFYTAKADRNDRLGSKHPTVKPLDLMQYLVRLVTRKGGLVLDPFAGTGTTGEAAWREGMKCILIEREEEYQKDIRLRMNTAKDYYAREMAKVRNKPKDDPLGAFK